jgi:hypothetical protein
MLFSKLVKNHIEMKKKKEFGPQINQTLKKKYELKKRK